MQPLAYAVIIAAFMGFEHLRGRWTKWDGRIEQVGSRLDRRFAREHTWGLALSGVIGVVGLGCLLLGRARELTPLHGLMIASLTLALSSWIWADDRRITFHRNLILLAHAVGVIGLAMTSSLAEMATLVALGTGTYLLVGVIDDVARLRFFRAHGYRFGGTLHPNKQAVHCALLALSTAYLWQLQLLSAIAAASILAVAALLLLFSGSRTSFACVAAAGVVWVLFERPELSAVGWWLPLAVAVAGGGMLWRRGREGTTFPLNGRWPLWAWTLSNLRSRPFLGFGHGSFWNATRVQEAGRRWGWTPFSSHCAYIDVPLNTGLLGLSLFIATLAVACVQAAGAPTPHGGFILATTVFVALHGTFESMFITPSFRPFAFALLLFAFRG